VAPTRLPTRLRAWLLRTFAGRTAAESGWDEPAMPAVARSGTFRVGELTVTASSLGVRATGINRPSIVYEVRVTREGDARSWSSKYGLDPKDDSPEAAAEMALNELDQIWRDREGWAAQATEGMSEDEAEAMLDSPILGRDLRAADWIGPQLDELRPGRESRGGWLPG